MLHKSDKSLEINVSKSKELFEKYLADAKIEVEDLNVNKFSSKLYHMYLEFFNKYIKDFESLIQYVIENLIKPQEIKISNYNEFLNLINNILKILKFHINKKLVKDNNNNNIKNDLESENNILFKAYKSIKNNNNEVIINVKETAPIVKEIYSNYLYIFNNYKFQNQRVLSNATDLFKSLFKLLKNVYEFTENQFQNYFDEFVSNFNNLFLLIDLKIYGEQLDNQLKFDKDEKIYIDLLNKTNKIHEEFLNYISNHKKELEKKNKEIIDNFLLKYDADSNEKKEENFEKIEKEIQENIENYNNKINEKVNDFNQIYNELNVNNKENSKITIKYSNISLNKDSRATEEFIYDESGFSNFFKTIGNIAIGISNWFKERKKIEQNLNDYYNEISNLIENSNQTFTEMINSKKEKITKIIEGKLDANNCEFKGIKQNRTVYEKIKKDYFNIIYKQ